MEVAKLILEYLKVLAWPLVVLLLILTTDALLEKVLDSLTPKRDRERLRVEQAQFVLMSMAREVEKVLVQLVELDFAAVAKERHFLTPGGRSFFEKVAARQRHLLSRFAPTA